MSLVSRFLRSFSMTQRHPVCISSPRRARLSLEALEDRCVPTAALTAITSNFNGTAIPAGDTIWFSSVFKASGLGSGPVTLYFTNQTITFQASGNSYSVPVPDTAVTFSPVTTQASTSFGTGWATDLPMNFSGNGFLSGAAFQVPAGGLPGGIKPVTWSGQVGGDTAGVSVNWQWAAAVYTTFGTDYNGVNVKPVDDPHVSAYANSDHAGTPEAFKSYVIGGARGGGGSNYTGSYSATASVAVPVVSSPVPSSPASTTASLSGNITGPTGVTVTMTGTTVSGQMLVYTTTTDANVLPGTYTITETLPSGSSYVETGTSVGSVNGTAEGSTDGTSMTVALQAGDNGVNYDFFNGLPS